MIGRGGKDRRVGATVRPPHLVLAAVLICAGSSGHAQEVSLAVPDSVDGRPIERWEASGRALVAGEIVAGVMIGGRFLGPPRPIAAIQGESQACLGMVSRDGAYWSETDYRVEGIEARASFDFATRFPEAFETDVTIAMRVTPGRCGERRRTYVVVSADERPVTDSFEVSVLVNGLGADTVSLAFIGAAGPALVQCHRLDGGRTTGFDFECILDPADSRNAPSFVLQRQRGVSYLPPLSFEIVGWP